MRVDSCHSNLYVGWNNIVSVETEAVTRKKSFFFSICMRCTLHFLATIQVAGYDSEWQSEGNLNAEKLQKMIAALIELLFTSAFYTKKKLYKELISKQAQMQNMHT